MSKKKIYKVQVPVSTNEPVPVAMVYTKGRQNQQLVPVSQVSKHFKPGEFKKFFYATWDSVLDQITIHKPAPFQDW